MAKLHRPSPNRKQLLYFAKDQMIEGYFAAIRITWFSTVGACSVSELVVRSNDIDAISQFPQVIKEALASGADVSIVSFAESQNFGLMRI
jgi:hypothetical protein|tara:strand:- start:256 stop:525 length:270 start_codon:yes stop_codon:yes gene_type:complete